MNEVIRKKMGPRISSSKKTSTSLPCAHTHREERAGLATHVGGGQHQLRLHPGACPHEGRGRGDGDCVEGKEWGWVGGGMMRAVWCGVVWFGVVSMNAAAVPNGGGAGRFLRCGSGGGDADGAGGLAWGGPRRRPARPEGDGGGGGGRDDDEEKDKGDKQSEGSGRFLLCV